MKKDNSKKDAKKEAKKAAQAAIVKQGQTLKAALDLSTDPLTALPPMFLKFCREGVDGAFELVTRASMAPADKLALIRAGALTADDAKQLADDGTQMLILRATATAPPSPAASPSSSPAKQAPETPDVAEPASAGEEQSKAGKVPDGEILAFIHYGYKIEHDVLIMSINDIHVNESPSVRRKGVGKFMMFVCEMLAKKAGMNGTMTSVPRCVTALHRSQHFRATSIDLCLLAMPDLGVFCWTQHERHGHGIPRGVQVHHRQYIAVFSGPSGCRGRLRCAWFCYRTPRSSCHSLPVAMLVDVLPLLLLPADSEIYSKIWDADARALVDKKAAVIRSSNSVEGKAKAAMKAEKDSAAASLAGVREKKNRNEFQM